MISRLSVSSLLLARDLSLLKIDCVSMFWSSSGQFDGSGMLVQTGGDADGLSKV